MKNLWANCDGCEHKGGPYEFCYHCFITKPPSRWEANKVNNINVIGHIIEMYASNRKHYSLSKETILSVAAAVSALARSDKNYDEEIKK